MDLDKVYVGCCMVILNPAEDKVLLAVRKKDPDIGGLQLPGGTVDYASGENIKSAVIREIKEETGLILVEPEFLCMMNTFYYGKERPLHIAFIGKSETEELPPNPEPHKAENWKWVPLDDLPNEKYFRMSKIAIDFFNEVRKNPTARRFLVDREYMVP
jgi:ADP-ribose pyrophosphatase YjhB (NUDIX family)